MKTRDLYVARPDLPPLADLLPLLEEIWANRILTNGGPMHERFETALASTLGVTHTSLFANATIALLLALRALVERGEVITTPYSFAATTHAIAWNGLTPVFADVDPVTLNLDPARVEAAITPRTRAILAVHCYGIPCDVDALASIAAQHGLALVYDAAHAFGVQDAGGSILRHGDLAVVSFHATKVFTTFEGGAIVSGDAAMKTRIDRLKNFGIVDEGVIDGVGLNGKMNEFQAAVGLLGLQRIEEVRERRAGIAAIYRERLACVDGVQPLAAPRPTVANEAYFPVFVRAPWPTSRDELQRALKTRGVVARRYFHPTIAALPHYHHHPSASSRNLPNATAAAERVLCLPLHTGMTDDDAHRVVDAIEASR